MKKDAMLMGKMMARVGGAALLLFGLNGLINFWLMQPIEGGASEPLLLLRRHLDDAAFVLLFGFAAIVFWAMYAVLRSERGYLYLGLISLLTSLQLFWDWNDKTLLFGPFPDIPYGSLAFKSGIVFLAFSFIAYLLQTGDRVVTRSLLGGAAVLWAAVVMALLVSAASTVFVVLDRLFLVCVFANMLLSIGQFVAFLRRKEQQTELRRIAAGFILFAIVLLPDPVKDVLEQIAGHGLGYRMSFWEQCLEDTFPLALFALLAVFGVLFFDRFVQTLHDNKAATEELRANNAALALEVDTRQRLDLLLSAMLRTYRAADWEKCVIREGKRYFQPHTFVLVKYSEDEDAVVLEGEAGMGAASLELDIRAALRSNRSRHASFDAIVTSTLVMGAAGGSGTLKLFLAVHAADGGKPIAHERDKFALLLMAKYVSIFYEYFQLLESRLKEMELRQGDRTPWLSRLFMQMAEKERKRLASDLHDEVLQELLHIRRTLDRTPTGQWSQEDKEQLRIGLENAEFMIRETCRELMPSFLSDQGVLDAMAKLVERTRLRADFQLEFEARPITAALSDEKTTTIYRVVQELIHNAMKHSEAGRVRLEISQDEGSVQIRYEDDGKGMNPDTDFAATSRFGLRGMTERIHLVDGEMSIQSEPGRGVKMRLAVPV